MSGKWKWCVGGNTHLAITHNIHQEYNDPHNVSWEEARDGRRPTDVKRIITRCPKCNKRLKSSVKACNDGCCVYHSIPRHVAKGGKKKNKKPRRKWK